MASEPTNGTPFAVASMKNRKVCNQIGLAYSILATADQNVERSGVVRNLKRFPPAFSNSCYRKNTVVANKEHSLSSIYYPLRIAVDLLPLLAVGAYTLGQVVGCVVNNGFRERVV